MIISLAKINLGGGSGGGGSMSATDEYVIARALNRLNNRMNEVNIEALAEDFSTLEEHIYGEGGLDERVTALEEGNNE